MKKIVEANTGEVKFASDGVILRSIAIGSCIAIAAYDARKRTGAMAHVMLPGLAPEKETQPTRYAANAINEIIDLMARAGTRSCDIEACLVGAGNVLEKEDDTVCKANVESVMQLLEEKNIPVRATVLGGTERKGVFMDIENGEVFYTEGENEKKLLWYAGGRNER
jgi:chemotaxis protein CheD